MPKRPDSETWPSLRSSVSPHQLGHLKVNAQHPVCLRSLTDGRDAAGQRLLGFGRQLVRPPLWADGRLGLFGVGVGPNLLSLSPPSPSGRAGEAFGAGALGARDPKLGVPGRGTPRGGAPVAGQVLRATPRGVFCSSGEGGLDLESLTGSHGLFRSVYGLVQGL